MLKALKGILAHPIHGTAAITILTYFILTFSGIDFESLGVANIFLFFGILLGSLILVAVYRSYLKSKE